MWGRPGRGAVIGLGVGAALVVLLIGLPAVISGDYYEITDPLVYMGLPILVVSGAVGAGIGAALPPAHRETTDGRGQQPSRTGRAAVGLVAVTVTALAVWFFLSAIGAVAATVP